MIYRVYGLDIHSPFPLSGMPHGTGRGFVVPITTGKHFADALCRGRTEVVSSHGKTVTLTGIKNDKEEVMGIRYIVEKDFGFDIDIKGRSIHYFPIASHDPDLYQFWLLKSILIFHLNGIGIYNFLHAGAVEINNKAVAFVGAPFAGKSTLTSYCIGRDHLLITDDFLAIQYLDNSFRAVPSFPFVRPSRIFESLGEHVENFPNSSLEIDRIYSLSFAEPTDAVHISPISPSQRFMVLFDNCAKLRFRMREQFDFFTRMSLEVPLFSLKVPKDLLRLEDVYSAIINHRPTSAL